MKKIIKNKILIYYYLSWKIKISYLLLFLIIEKKFFQETIDSICKQTFKNIEILVVYDDTDKGELDFVKKTLIKSKLSFNLIVNSKNIGVGNQEIKP